MEKHQSSLKKITERSFVKLNNNKGHSFHLDLKGNTVTKCIVFVAKVRIGFITQVPLKSSVYTLWATQGYASLPDIISYW